MEVVRGKEEEGDESELVVDERDLEEKEEEEGTNGETGGVKIVVRK